MNGEVIKSFLVGLGFGVDESSLAKFNKSITSATLKVAALYGSVKTASAGIVYGISKISEGFEQMGYEYHIIAPAINKALVLRRELLKAYSAAGINITKVIQSSVKLNLSLQKTKFAFEAIYKSVGSRFFELLTKNSDTFRQKLYANLPKIQNILETFIKLIFRALQATTELGIRLWSILGRVYDFFVKLDRATDGWSTIILGVVAAWKLLNLSFLATPLGMILSGFVAILALYDDFKTFEEGGKSFFNWSTFIPVINAVTAALTSLWAVFQNLVASVAELVLGFYQLFKGDKNGFWEAWINSSERILDIWTNIKGVFSGVGASLGALTNWASGLLGGPNAAANLQGTPNGVPAAAPIGGGVQNAQTNQHVQQQTQINVAGSADANAVGKAVAGEQSRVNFDMTRNLKGATR